MADREIDGIPMLEMLKPREREAADRAAAQARDMVADGWKPDARDKAWLDEALIKEDKGFSFRLTDEEKETINANARKCFGGS